MMMLVALQTLIDVLHELVTVQSVPNIDEKFFYGAVLLYKNEIKIIEEYKLCSNPHSF
jgi:hypothetical protein